MPVSSRSGHGVVRVTVDRSRGRHLLPRQPDQHVHHGGKEEEEKAEEQRGAGGEHFARLSPSSQLTAAGECKVYDPSAIVSLRPSSSPSFPGRYLDHLSLCRSGVRS